MEEVTSQKRFLSASRICFVAGKTGTESMSNYNDDGESSAKRVQLHSQSSSQENTWSGSLLSEHNLEIGRHMSNFPCGCGSNGLGQLMR